MRCQTNKLLKSEEKKEVIFFYHSSTLTSGPLIDTSRSALSMSFFSVDRNLIFILVAVGDSQEFQEVSRPVSWNKDYLMGS